MANNTILYLFGYKNKQFIQNYIRSGIKENKELYKIKVSCICETFLFLIIYFIYTLNFKSMIILIVSTIFLNDCFTSSSSGIFEYANIDNSFVYVVFNLFHKVSKSFINGDSLKSFSFQPVGSSNCC